MNRLLVFLIIILGLAIILVGCNLPTPEPISPAEMTSDAKTRVAEGVSDELTRVAGGDTSPSDDSDQPADDSASSEIETATPSLTPTISATPTATPTPTSDKVLMSVSVDTNCRFGPGSVYDYLGALLVGETAEVIARNANSTYYYIQNPDNPLAYCWAWAEYATITGNTRLLPVYTPPPTPTFTPSPTFTPIPLDFNLGAATQLQCGLDYFIIYPIENTGPIPLESYEATGKLDTNETRYRAGDSFGSHPHCAAGPVAAIAPGETYFIGIQGYSIPPAGHTVETTIKVCSLDGGAGICVTKSMTSIVLSVSDEDVKEEIEDIDEQEILARLLELPISTWNYDWEDEGVRHIGPMAQDFYEAFNLGDDDRSINPVDSNGVAFAAIQALAENLAERDEQLAVIDRRLETIESQLISNQNADWSTILIATLSFTIGVLLTVMLTSMYWRRKINDEDPT